MLDKILKEMMAELVKRLLVTKEEAAHYSWHSFRATLATALLAAGASGPQIQACCRWMSEKSVPVYAAFTAEAYSALVRKALKQDVSTASRSRRAGELKLSTDEWIQYDDSLHVQALLAQH
jgi:site-specific recombinase XerD